MTVCAVKLKMLCGAKYLLLAQEVGVQSPECKDTNGYDDVVYGMILGFVNSALLENWCQSCLRKVFFTG